MDYRVISIGALSAHELWGEKVPTRTAHATTTLVRSGKRIMVVDPGMPPQVMAARFNERTGLTPDAVTDVFLTNFRPAHRRGVSAFTNARLLIGEVERETVGGLLVEKFKEEQDQEVRAMLKQDIELLKRCEPAPDKLADQVDLFPLPGFTPGTCGLLLLSATTTTLIAGDAVATSEHLGDGRVLRGAYDTEQARASFLEAVEIADVIIPGHDNIVVNPSRRGL